MNRGVEPEAEMAPRNEDMVEVKTDVNIFRTIKNNLMDIKSRLIRISNDNEGWY